MRREMCDVFSGNVSDHVRADGQSERREDIENRDDEHRPRQRKRLRKRPLGYVFRRAMFVDGAASASPARAATSTEIRRMSMRE